MGERSRLFKLLTGFLTLIGMITGVSNLWRLTTRIEAFHPAAGIYTAPEDGHVMLVWRVEGIGAKAWLDGERVSLDDSRDFKINGTHTFSLKTSGLIGSETRPLTITVDAASHEVHGKRAESRSETAAIGKPGASIGVRTTEQPQAGDLIPSGASPSERNYLPPSGAVTASNKSSENLSKMTGSQTYLNVRFEPSDSVVEISGLGRYLGGTATVACNPGTYTITAHGQLLTSQSKTVAVSAGEHADVSIQLTPDRQAIHDQLALANSRVRSRDFTEAVQIAKTVLAADPDNQDARIILPSVYFRARDMPDFYTSARQALQHGAAISVQLAHAHEFPASILHPVILTIAPAFISFNSFGGGTNCNLPSYPIQFTSIATAAVTNGADGQTYLGLRFHDSARPGRLIELRLWVSDAREERRTAQHDSFLKADTVIVSPPEAATVLGTVAALLHQYMVAPQ